MTKRRAKLNPTQERISKMLAANGVQNPGKTVLACEEAGAKLAECVVTLFEETSGGYNEWGHDPGGAVQGGTVTKASYRHYERLLAEGAGTVQGCGPCQLTSRGLQLEADKLGGCWNPYFNMVVGFRFHQSLGSTAWSRFYHYNGSGPAAAAYATRSVALTVVWKARIRRARRRK